MSSPQNQADQENQQIFKAARISLVYTYPGDQAGPEASNKEYQVGGFAAETILDRCSDASLVHICVEFEKLRAAFLRIVGLRGLGAMVDRETARFFQVGKLDPLQFSTTPPPSRSTRPRPVQTIPDFDLLED